MVDPTKAFQTILDAIGEGGKPAGAFPKPKKSFTDIVKGALGKTDEPAPPPPTQLGPPPKPTPSFPGQAPPAPPKPPSSDDILKQIDDILKSVGQPKAEPIPPQAPAMAMGPPKTPTYGQTGQVPITEAPTGETKIPVDKPTLYPQETIDKHVADAWKG